MYNLEVEKVIADIKKNKAKLVCLNLPDGFKPRAKELQDAIKKETGAQVILWGGSCYGSCDVPLEVKRLGVDLLVHFGHAAWRDGGKREYLVEE